MHICCSHSAGRRVIPNLFIIRFGVILFLRRRRRRCLQGAGVNSGRPAAIKSLLGDDPLVPRGHRELNRRRRAGYPIGVQTDPRDTHVSAESDLHRPQPRRAGAANARSGRSSVDPFLLTNVPIRTTETPIAGVNAISRIRGVPRRGLDVGDETAYTGICREQATQREQAIVTQTP